MDDQHADWVFNLVTGMSGGRRPTVETWTRSGFATAVSARGDAAGPRAGVWRGGGRAVAQSEAPAQRRRCDARPRRRGPSGTSERRATPWPCCETLRRALSVSMSSLLAPQIAGGRAWSEQSIPPAAEWRCNLGEGAPAACTREGLAE